MFNFTRKYRAKTAWLVSTMMLVGLLSSTSIFAAQTGSVKGTVSTQSAGISVAGVTITATSDVMPKARTVQSKSDGSFELPFLIPGIYEVTMSSADGTVETSTVEVKLNSASQLNFVLESNDNNVITIIGTSTIVTEGKSSLTNSLGQEQLDGLPTGDTYRDMLKLIPGVGYSENSTLGPQSGGSGSDNKYGFDGIDVSLPLYGNLSAEPSTHDMQSVSIDLGGAKAVGFNRSGGFAIDTISKSGTNEFHGSFEYKMQPEEFVGSSDTDSISSDFIPFEDDKNWITASLSGPIIEDSLFFYGSFYRPETTRANIESYYGEVKDYKQIREEYFGKLTYAPTDDLLFNLSMRTSDREGQGEGVDNNDHNSTSENSNAYQDIYTFEGSWVIGPFTTLNFMYGEFSYKTFGGADNVLGLIPTLGDSLDLNNLDQIGNFSVPEIEDDQDPVVAQWLIDQYGYVGDTGMLTGGGNVGVASTFTNLDFYRDSLEISLDHEMDIGSATHKLHLGYKWQEASEVLRRTSNGWGRINYNGGEPDDDDDFPDDAYYRTYTQQMGLIDMDPLTSVYESFNIEFNDTIEHGDFTYNVGFLISNDILYGQGLAPADTISGFVDSPGTKYKMKEVDWSDMIQPRLGVIWAYNGVDTVFANFAKYNPEATSLPRAASWARNIASELEAFYDINGDYISHRSSQGSSGKLWQEGIKPRQILELTLGTSKMLSNDLYVRAHVRRREGSHFWEDTWNGSRNYGDYDPFGGVPDHIAALGDYIDNHTDMRDQLEDSRVGAIRGTSYVIAELDDSYTSYNEFHIEAEYQGDRTYLKASYTWNHYYGNFDQDKTTGTNDANTFIGSSWLADGRGRQIWDGREGKLSGDKPILFKIYGYYTTDWDANIGAYFTVQSGEVWEMWDGSVYGYSSSTSRYAESAGNRRSSNHAQLDLNYSQNFELTADVTLQFRADLFNVLDNQTGYNINPYFSDSEFGIPRSQYNPRRLQLSFKVGF